MFTWFLAAVFGLFIGTAISLSIFSKKLNESNNIGDSTSGFDDVCPDRVYFSYRSTFNSTASKADFFKNHGLSSYSKQGIKKTDYSSIDDVIPDEIPDVDIPLFKPLS